MFVRLIVSSSTTNAKINLNIQKNKLGIKIIHYKNTNAK